MLETIGLFSSAQETVCKGVVPSRTAGRTVAALRPDQAFRVGLFCRGQTALNGAVGLIADARRAGFGVEKLFFVCLFKKLGWAPEMSRGAAARFSLERALNFTANGMAIF